ncbi:PH domain-containing protein [Streptomyces durbertensis]|uniref:PH domain-containing protein n=1 Tax=Streptomyces durbertensis TaxID=2448886 RepID=A0ABR6EF73_9ACTN|nr:PH domain-containing protein [Streptomyces durbertensis]MBB1243119.1 PH domain-containing protein [Streptomyces durbertensis]
MPERQERPEGPERSETPETPEDSERPEHRGWRRDHPPGGTGPAGSGEPAAARGLARLLPARPEGRRLHPVTPWRRTWAPIAALAVFAVQDFNRAREWFTQLTLGWLLVAFLLLLPAAAAYGFLSWWVTSYQVTNTELRIRTGLLFRRVAHIRLDRLQAVDVTRPLLARAVGVAKLKLDVVGTNDKDELAFVGEADAVALRAELLARAAGIAPEAAPSAGEAPERELVRVPPSRLTVALLLMGTGWGFLLATIFVPVLIYSWTGSVGAAIATGVPMLGGAWVATLGRYLTEYDWKVAESPDGLRLDHGLLNREHATVPPGRVQSVRIVEPLLWRRLDWVRVELEVAGSDIGNSVLLPVAPRGVAAGVLARVLPGVDLDEAARVARPVPRRARWAVPVWWQGYGHGVTDAVFATRRGLLRRELTLVPHAKVQSVRLTQGPWERRLRLADVLVDHGANGTASARLRDVDEAYAIVDAQADRSRTGRRTARPDRWLT